MVVLTVNSSHTLCLTDAYAALPQAHAAIPPSAGKKYLFTPIHKTFGQSFYKSTKVCIAFMCINNSYEILQPFFISNLQQTTMPLLDNIKITWLKLYL